MESVYISFLFFVGLDELAPWEFDILYVRFIIGEEGMGIATKTT